MIQRFRTVFALGGPGSGKGTQCYRIEQMFRFKHLSAGQLLREEQNRQGSELGATIEKIILEGAIVPSHITVSLLKTAMRTHPEKPHNFLIDGFPRNLQNLNSWKSLTKSFSSCPFVLHFKCSQPEMIRRLLKRGESSNRSDDNMEVIQKRLKTYYGQTSQVLRQFEKENKVFHIDSDSGEEPIFQSVKHIFEELMRKDKME